MTKYSPDISVIILSYNSAKYLEKCLDSVLFATKTNNMIPEIFVMDNGSSDGSVEILEKYKLKFPDIVRLKLFGKNMGTTVSRNYGLSRARGKYFLVLDSDAYINHAALAHLLVVLDTSPDIGMVVPKILYPSGKFQKSTDVFPYLTHKARRFLFLKLEEKKDEQRIPDQAREVDYAISAFWLFGRETVEKVGLLDENIFYSPEDVDYCIRIWKSGLKIIYDTRVEIIHDAQEISRKRFNYFFFSHIKGLFYLFGKHRYGIVKNSPLK